MALSKKQTQYLKGLAHSMKPVVLLGQHGLTEGVVAEIDLALQHHELVKIKIPGDDREMRALVIEAIIRETGAEKVQSIGKTLVIYKANPEKEQGIDLPRK